MVVGWDSRNATGQPAISLPLHWTDEGLPVGVQFAAEFGGELTLLKIARQSGGGLAMVRETPHSGECTRLTWRDWRV